MPLLLHRSCTRLHHGLELAYKFLLTWPYFAARRLENVVFGWIAMCPAKNLPPVEKGQLDTWDNKLSFHRPCLTSPLNNEENLPRHHLLPPSDSPLHFIGQGSSWASSLSARKPDWDAGPSRKKRRARTTVEWSAQIVYQMTRLQLQSSLILVFFFLVLLPLSLPSNRKWPYLARPTQEVLKFCWLVLFSFIILHKILFEIRVLWLEEFEMTVY